MNIMSGLIIILKKNIIILFFIIKKNEIFTKENLKIIRPFNGLDPKYFKNILGKRSRQNLKFATPLEKKHYKSK